MIRWHSNCLSVWSGNFSFFFFFDILWWQIITPGVFESLRKDNCGFHLTTNLIYERYDAFSTEMTWKLTLKWFNNFNPLFVNLMCVKVWKVTSCDIKKYVEIYKDKLQIKKILNEEHSNFSFFFNYDEWIFVVCID